MGLAVEDIKQKGILAMLIDQLPPAQRGAIFGVSPGGAATSNPLMLMQSPQISGILQKALNQGLIPDGAAPNRNVMEIPPQPFGNMGIHSYPFPGARLPNVYRGPLTPPGVPGVPDAPEYFVPGFEGYWLKKT